MTKSTPPQRHERLVGWIMRAYPRHVRDRFEAGLHDALARDYKRLMRANMAASELETGRIAVAKLVARGRESLLDDERARRCIAPSRGHELRGVGPFIEKVAAGGAPALIEPRRARDDREIEPMS